MDTTAPTADGSDKSAMHVEGGVSLNAASNPVETGKELDAGDVPDPDEDDLDDLDEMLDEFSSVKLDDQGRKPETTNHETSQRTVAPSIEPKSTEEEGDGVSEEDFAKQLQAGMANLLGELEKSPEMQQEFEDMFKQITAAAETGVSDATTGDGETKSTTGGATDASFQETIRRTMERMQTSGDQATAAAASGGGDDFMSELLKQMGSGDLSGEGGEEEFSKMLMGMMEQLTNKDILYEPMKELHDKFPGWLEKNKATTTAEDLKRYEEQKVLVAEIVGKFEAPGYSDSNAADREYIVERMQKMQEAGSPPADLVGDMASAQEAFNGPDEQCNPQ